jgi:trimeric autotransporter adhesin
MLVAFSTSIGLLVDWNPNANDAITALAVASNTIYVAGFFTAIGGAARPGGMAALDAISGAATSWQPVPNNRVHGLAASGTTVYAGGFFTQIDGQPRAGLAALDASTGRVAAWNPGTNGAVYDLALQGAAVVVGGYLSSMGGQARNGLAALDLASGRATAWQPTVNGIVRVLAVQGSSLYIGGDFTQVNGQPRNRLAAFDLSTGALRDWNPNANGSVLALLATPGAIYIGGDFTQIAGLARDRVAALDTTTDQVLPWAGGRLFIGGVFAQASGQPRSNLAALDAQSGALRDWRLDVAGDAAAVDVLAANQNTVYIGGSFGRVGGQRRVSLAAADTASAALRDWQPALRPLSAPNPPAVYDLALDGTTMYVAGSFTTETGDCLAAFDATSGQLGDWHLADICGYALAVRDHVVYTAGGGRDVSAIGGVAVAPTIASAAAPSATQGAPYRFQLRASGYPTPTFEVATGSLPPGLTLDRATGLISGTPTQAGSYRFAIGATNGARPAASQTFTITVVSHQRSVYLALMRS